MFVQGFSEIGGGAASERLTELTRDINTKVTEVCGSCTHTFYNHQFGDHFTIFSWNNWVQKVEWKRLRIS